MILAGNSQETGQGIYIQIKQAHGCSTYYVYVGCTYTQSHILLHENIFHNLKNLTAPVVIYTML